MSCQHQAQHLVRRGGHRAENSQLLGADLAVHGAVAVVQRGYLPGKDADCATIGTIAVTVVAGPLNYAGVNPKIEKCDLPDPSKEPSRGKRGRR